MELPFDLRFELGGKRVRLVHGSPAPRANLRAIVDTRGRVLERLRSERFDLLVIGGGIVGAGSAAHAARLGLRVALVDRADFASGTSSASSKLIHGGLRYLRMGDFRLIREALYEERVLAREVAPHLVHELPFLLPVERDRPYGPTAIRAALATYSGLTGAPRLRGLTVTPDQATELVPPLDVGRLSAVGLYQDAQGNDARLCLANVRAAADAGAAVAGRIEVVALECSNGGIAATVRDNVEGGAATVTTRAVVNASGAAVDEVRRLEDPRGGASITLSKGAQLVLDRPEHWAAGLTIPVDHTRVAFAVPFEDLLLLGTSDTLFEPGRDTLEVTAQEEAQIFAETGRVLPAELLRPQVIRYRFAGLRVLPLTGRSPSSGSARGGVFSRSARNGLGGRRQADHVPTDRAVGPRGSPERPRIASARRPSAASRSRRSRDHRRDAVWGRAGARATSCLDTPSAGHRRSRRGRPSARRTRAARLGRARRRRPSAVRANARVGARPGGRRPPADDARLPRPRRTGAPLANRAGVGDTLILAIDQGTTGTTCLVVDDQVRVRGRGYAEVPQHYPRPGWIEHDPEEIWQSVEDAASAAIDAAGIAPPDLAVIGITNQRETTVLWERESGRPVHPAIVWQDRRTAERCARLPADLLRRHTGLVPDPYFSATKLEWLLERTERAPEELAFGTVDSWLVWKLTGGRLHVTDRTNASRTLLLGLDSLGWDDELLDLFGVPRSLLPELCGSSEVIGEAELLGARLPVAGIAGDQQAALVGQGCFSAGQAKATYGTGTFVLVDVGESPLEPPAGPLETAAAAVDGERRYALEGSVLTTGAVVQWLRDGLGLLDSEEESETLAREVDSTGGVYLVPALAGLGSPHWNPYARGLLCGLTSATTRAHVARAALQGIAFSVADVLDALPEPLEVLRADGGASANGFLMEFQADLLGCPVEVAAERETTALGAAALAGLATGVWASPGEFATHLRRGARYEPARARSEVDDMRAGWRRALQRTLLDAHQL
jgi:glycerol kinase